MKFLILLTLLGFGSCSSHKSPENSDYLQLYQTHLKQHQACVEHRDKVLLKAFTESENADLDDEQYYFIRNEQAALKYIESFDVTKFTLKENQLEYEAIVKACVQKRDPQHKPCDTLYPAFKFFRALNHGMNQYGWSVSTKKKGTSTTLTYLHYVGESESSIMDLLFANDLLTRLIRRGYVKSNILNETIQFRRDTEEIYRKLMNEIRKIGKRDLTCKEANAFYAKERLKIKELSTRFRSILTQVES